MTFKLYATQGDVYTAQAPVSGAQNIPQYSLVNVKTTGAGQGTLVAASDTSAQAFFGLLKERKADNSSGVSGDEWAEPITDGKVWSPFTGSVTLADIGKQAYVANSTQLTTATGSNSLAVGVIRARPPGLTSSTTASVDFGQKAPR